MTQHAVKTHAPSTPGHDDLRLSRLAQACRTGNLAGATMELREWVQRENGPAAARVLLAALLARQGERTAALKTIEPAIQHPIHDSEPAAIRLALALLIDAGLHEDARAMAMQILEASAKEQPIEHPLIAWMAVMAVPGTQAHDFETLAKDPWASGIAQAPETVPSIVHACQMKPDPKILSRLRRAIGQIIDLPSLEHVQSDLCAAMAELALLADDRDNARLWAKRGLGLSPFHAPLAIALNRASETQNARDNAQALDVLARVHTQFPSYPDLTAALIRREHGSGRTDSAQHRLDRWLQAQPRQAIARRLKQELAA